MRLVSSRGNQGARRGTQETAAHAKGRPQEEPTPRSRTPSPQDARRQVRGPRAGTRADSRLCPQAGPAPRGPARRPAHGLTRDSHAELGQRVPLVWATPRATGFLVT